MEKGWKMSIKPTRFLPEHIQEALKTEIAPQKKATNICIYNFEASNVAADTVSSYVFSNYDVQVHTMIDRNVPSWVDGSVDVVIMSYSGNSQEVEQVYNGVKEHTDRIHCVTSGGKLKEFCEKDGMNFIPIPAGLSNAEATGYEVGVLINLYESMGINGIRDALLEAMPRIVEYRDRVWNSDYARNIAARMEGKIPVIYCIGELRAVHKRWKMLINQVAGELAFSGELPEFDHNEIVSWSENSDNEDFIILMVKSESDSELLDHIEEAVSSLLKKHGLNMEILEIEGKLMERGLRGIILADAVANFLKEVE